MSAELWVNDNGTAREIQEIWVNDSGTARQIQEIWVNDNGTARLVYQAIQITLQNASYIYFGGTPCEFHLNSDGFVYTRTSSTLTQRYAWISNPAMVGQYECRATVTSGSLSAGTTGAWQSCATTRTWTRGTGAGTSAFCGFTLEIRSAATAAVAASATITIEADRT
jgi:hypothetical protein